MYTTNFEYDGKQLSDFGMMICSFDAPGMETVSSGADITFHTIKSAGSDKVKLYGSKYEETYTSTFQVCLDSCGNDNVYLEPNRISALQRWLCRKDGYHQFKPIQEDLLDIYWNAVFGCRQIEVNGMIAGLELTMYTDAPYAYLASQPVSYSLSPGSSISLFDSSDEVGSIYPTVTINCHSAGKIILKNNLDNKTTILTNLSDGEMITLDGENKILSSEILSDEDKYVPRTDFANYFNYHFPRIFNKIENGADIRENIFTLSEDSIPCDITFKYSPIIKIGL